MQTKVCKIGNVLSLFIIYDNIIVHITWNLNAFNITETNKK